MLKGIPSVFSPELMKILMEMGHGDEIVIADGNFPAANLGQRLVTCSGTGVREVLDAVMKFFPLDTFTEDAVFLMAVVPGDLVKPLIWEDFKKIIAQYEIRNMDFKFLERNAFYERTKKAFAVIATSESARYANIILKKGVVEGDTDQPNGWPLP
jgi:L-fucose mutarotase